MQAYLAANQGLPCCIAWCPPESYYHANVGGYKILKCLLDMNGNCQNDVLSSGDLY